MLRARIKNSIRSYPLKPIGGTPPFSFGNALQFDGVNDYVTCDFAGEAAIKTNQAFTIATYFKFPNAIGNFTPRLFGLSNNVNDRVYAVGLTTAAGYTDLFAICEAAPIRKRITYTFSTDTWYHLVISYNGSGFGTIGNYKIYVNAVSQTINTANPFSAAVPNDILLGGHFVGAYQGEKTIDQFLFWDNYQLTDQEVIDLYNGGAGQYPSIAVAGNTPKVQWELNESGTDTTAIDGSGNGNNGTLNNFSTPPDYWVAH